jgi:hypothetical protein
MVCDGLPDAAHVIIIGQNPATDMNTDWWSYWDQQTGFQYDRFLADYQRGRAQRGEPKTSVTRLRLNRVRQNGIRAVETNAYQNQQSGGAGRRVQNYSLLNLLIENMSALKAIIAYGQPAQEFVEKADLPDGLAVIRTKHLRFLSYSEVDTICRQIAAIQK